MIPLGRISIRGERGEDRMSRLTKEQQYSLMTFFAIFRSPLMFGGDMPSLDTFTTSLLTNKAVLKMHKESKDVKQVSQKDDKLIITSVNAKTGERYLAFFNLGTKKERLEISVLLSELGISKKVKVTNMWTGEKTGKVKDKISASLLPSASVLYSLKKLE
jgi:hypothetical protein